LKIRLKVHAGAINQGHSRVPIAPGGLCPHVRANVPQKLKQAQKQRAAEHSHACRLASHPHRRTSPPALPYLPGPPEWRASGAPSASGGDAASGGGDRTSGLSWRVFVLSCLARGPAGQVLGQGCIGIGIASLVTHLRVVVRMHHQQFEIAFQQVIGGKSASKPSGV
jgi:hypothetical protein